MKDDSPPTTTPPNPKKDTASDFNPLAKSRYKFYALAAILLLAFWSMFAGTITLRSNLSRLADDLDTPIHDDLDALETEEREKVVKHMWDVYTNNVQIRLPRFWQRAFEAAYEKLMSDVIEVREAAVLEIAKMYFHNADADPPPVQSLNRAQELSKNLKLSDRLDAANFY